MEDVKSNIIPTKVNKKAIFYGFLVGIGGNMLALAVAGAILGTIMARLNRLPDEVGALIEGPFIFMLSTIFFAIFSILGGFVAGRVAGHSHIRHAFYLGVIFWIIIILGILIRYLTNIGYSGIYGIAYSILGFVLIVPFVLFGGRLASKSRNSTK